MNNHNCAVFYRHLSTKLKNYKRPARRLFSLIPLGMFCYAVCITQCAYANVNDAVAQLQTQETATLNREANNVAKAKASTAKINAAISTQTQAKPVGTWIVPPPRFMYQSSGGSLQALLHNPSLHNQSQLDGSRAGGRAANGAMLFVSLSMPESLLLQMADEAHHFGIPVLLRGLVNNKMPDTLHLIAKLKQDAGKKKLTFDGFEIDPVWFQQFNITAVPALVVTKRPAHCMAQSLCPNQPFDVLYGNLAIEESLMRMEKNGSPELKAVAKNSLMARGI